MKVQDEGGTHSSLVLMWIQEHLLHPSACVCMNFDPRATRAPQEVHNDPLPLAVWEVFTDLSHFYRLSISSKDTDLDELKIKTIDPRTDGQLFQFGPDADTFEKCVYNDK